MLTQNFPAVAEAVLPASAVVAGSIAQPGVEKDPRARGERAGAGPTLEYHPGAIRAADVWERRLGNPSTPDEKVQVVQRSCPQAYQHFAGRGRGCRDVLVAQAVWSAELVKTDRLHRRVMLLKPPGGSPPDQSKSPPTSLQERDTE